MQVPTYDGVIGFNVRALREALGLTQAALAQRAREKGLRWSHSTVATIEAGRRSVPTRELPFLCELLETTLPDLLTCPADIHGQRIEKVELAEGVVVAARELRRFAHGKVARPRASWGPVRLDPDEARSRRQVAARFGLRGVLDGDLVSMDLEARGEAEREAARSLSERLGRRVEPFEVVAASYAVWDRTLTDEREEQLKQVAGEKESQRIVRRGHVTRRLLRELEERLRVRRVRRSK